MAPCSWFICPYWLICRARQGAGTPSLGTPDTIFLCPIRTVLEKAWYTSANPNAHRQDSSERTGVRASPLTIRNQNSSCRDMSWRRSQNDLSLFITRSSGHIVQNCSSYNAKKLKALFQVDRHDDQTKWIRSSTPATVGDAHRSILLRLPLYFFSISNRLSLSSFNYVHLSKEFSTHMQYASAIWLDCLVWAASPSWNHQVVLALDPPACLTTDQILQNLSPQAPRKSPHILSVCGTQAVSPEVAWNDGSGGFWGFSNYFSRPWYQQKAVQNVSGSISTKIPRITMKTTQTSVGEVSLIYLLTAWLPSKPSPINI